MCHYYFVHRKSHTDWPRKDADLGGYSLTRDRKNRFPPQGKKLNPNRKDQSGNAVGNNNHVWGNCNSVLGNYDAV